MRKGQQHSRAEAQACLLWSDRQGAEESAGEWKRTSNMVFSASSALPASMSRQALRERSERAREGLMSRARACLPPCFDRQDAKGNGGVPVS